MPEAARLIDQFKRAHKGHPWHGSSITAILKGVTARQAATPPPNGAHSIWALVLHVTNWRNEVAGRAAGGPAGMPAAGNWPAIGDPTPARWKKALAALDASHQNLVKAVRAKADDDFVKRTNDPRNRRLGTGVSYYELLHGIVQHDAYHAGQMAVLKKVLGFSGSRVRRF